MEIVAPFTDLTAKTGVAHAFKHYITLHTGGYRYLQLRSSDHMGNLRKGRCDILRMN